MVAAGLVMAEVACAGCARRWPDRQPPVVGYLQFDPALGRWRLTSATWHASLGIVAPEDWPERADAPVALRCHQCKRDRQVWKAKTLGGWVQRGSPLAV